MDNIKELEKIGLKRVCDETHIEQKYLKYMVENDYDKLDHINTLGFVKILSREYRLDLSAWTEAFEEYWIENRQEKEDGGLFIVVDDEKKSKKLLIFVLLILLGSTFSILFSLFQDKIDISNYISSDEITYEQTAIVQEAQESLDEVNSSFEDNETQETMLDETNSSEEILSTDDNETEKIVEEISFEQDNTQEMIVEKKTELKEIVELTEKVSPSFAQEAIITPNSQLWVGVIYLDTKKRRSFLGEGNFSIDISREQIITTGHGSFDVSINNEKKEFKQQAPIRFLVKDSNLTEISLSKFKELNEGKTW